MTRFSQAVGILTAGGEFRVWSVIVSIFGDLAREPEDEISGALLSALTERLGIRPEAVRVALHRLRKDGWITTRKHGRSGHYRLSPNARETSRNARERIYADENRKTDRWHLLILPPMPQSERHDREKPWLASGYASLVPGVMLGAGAAPVQSGNFTFEGEVAEIPAWVKSANAPTELIAGYARLETSLASIGTPLLDAPLEIAALRVLVIHQWRRLLLRHPALPDRFYPPEWREAACRQRVVELLKHLPRPSLAELENAASQGG
ncbi:MAG: Rrf2 family transcriptional regulator [Rhodobacteraceae bacterium]|nr:Rrf2 family transcriptional regulator [Paracoccaceae bacterium]